MTLDTAPVTTLDDLAPARDAVRARRPHRLARVIAVAVAVALLATAACLGIWLPATTVATDWSLAWAGLDVATAVTALTTAALLRAGDPRAALTASAGAALLVLDAWFDVCTSTGATQVLAVLEAALVEVPLAVLAVGLALRLVSSSAMRHH